LVDRRAFGAALAVWLVAFASPAAACRLALALAIDVSSSVDAREDALQRGGLAAALLAPEVEAAFFAGDRPVALAVYEWSGRYNQTLVLEWLLIETPADLLRAATIIGRSKRGYDDYPTAIGYALGYGAGLLARAPACLSQTIDIAGDGENNDGFGPGAAYAEFPLGGVTVNGLVVNAGEYEAELNLIEYYRAEILYGPGAFLQVAQGFDDYERAMRRKLERELRPKAVGALDEPLPGDTPVQRAPG
jgi:uncharacterized protein DUF1194